jgi:KDO2-lipid IV(A) lauroyltransferase
MQTMAEPHRLHTAAWRRALLWGSTTLPPSARVATMPLWAAIPFVLVPRARRQIIRNLEHILGPAAPPVAAARAYRVLLSFAQSLANSYAAHGGRGLQVEPELHGDARLGAARAQGRGVVVATGHIGPWQLGPYLLEQAGHGPVVLAMAREPDPGAQRVEEILELRRRFRVVYTDAPLASLELLRVLREGGVVALQMDRPPPAAAAARPGHGGRVVISFFDGQATFAAGPAALARAAGAPLVPVFLLARGPRRVSVEIGTPLEVSHSHDRSADLARAMRTLVLAYEACVRAEPYQFYNFHEFWVSG